MTSLSAPVPVSTLPKLLMADDHHLILDALQAMMKDEFQILAVDNSQAFIHAADEFQPDLAVLDVSMPGGDGFITARKVLERRPALPIAAKSPPQVHDRLVCANVPYQECRLAIEIGYNTVR